MIKFAVFFGLLTACGAIAINAPAQQLPNQADLKAAYCIPVVQNLVAIFSNADTAPERRQIFANRLDKEKTNLRRLQLYLMPRLSYLDEFSLQAARKRGDEDSARTMRDIDACLTTCQDEACFTKCHGDSDAWIRTETCKDLSFLPF